MEELILKCTSWLTRLIQLQTWWVSYGHLYFTCNSNITDIKKYRFPVFNNFDDFKTNIVNVANLWTDTNIQQSEWGLPYF